MAVIPAAFLSSNLLLNRTVFSQALLDHAFLDRTGLGLDLFRSGLEACGVRDERINGWIDDYQRVLSGQAGERRVEPLFRILDWIEAHPVESERALFRIPRGLFSANGGAGNQTYFLHPYFRMPEGTSGGEAVLGSGEHRNRSRPSKSSGLLALPDSHDEPKTALVSFRGTYREMVPTGEIGREIAVFRDKRKGFEDRLEALRAAGRILMAVDANGDDFFKGVVELFALAGRPRVEGPREFRDRLRLEAVRLLDAVLQRVPDDPRRQEILVHAYLKFQEAAHADLIRSSLEKNGTPGRALASVTEQIGYKLAHCEKHCSKAAQKISDETGWELVQSGMSEGSNHFDAPWTLEKAKQNGKMGLMIGGASFAGYTLLAGLVLLFSAPAAFWIFAFGSVLSAGAVLTGVFWRAPRRLRQKAVTLALGSGRRYVRELENRNRPALPKAKRRKLPPKRP